MKPEVLHAKPKVTALVPCYNAAAFISATLECLDTQTWPNLEILIGDDCSSDSTFELVSHFATGRSNVRVIRRQENMGWLGNSNDLMARASGEMMFFAFHDDLIAPTYVEKLVEALEANPRAVMAFTNIDVFEVDGTRRVWTFDALAGLRSALSRGLVMCTLERGWWVPNRGLFRSWAFHRIGGIKPNEKGEYSADWTWLLHMSLLGEFVRVPEILCRKYYKKDSLSKTWPHDKAQREALMRAGIREIRDSRIGLIQKMVLTRFLRNQMSRRKVHLPRWIKRLLHYCPVKPRADSTGWG